MIIVKIDKIPKTLSENSSNNFVEIEALDSGDVNEYSGKLYSEKCLSVLYDAIRKGYTMLPHNDGNSRSVVLLDYNGEVRYHVVIDKSEKS